MEGESMSRDTKYPVLRDTKYPTLVTHFRGSPPGVWSPFSCCWLWESEIINVFPTCFQFYYKVNTVSCGLDSPLNMLMGDW